MNQTLELTTLRTLVRQHIVTKISNGTLSAGDKISEQSIADAIGVSRTPTREALLQLNSEGLLDYFPRRGFAIKSPTVKEKNDTYEMVGMLDAFCARSAVNFITPQDIQDMNQIIDKIDISIKYRNLIEYRELQEDFHNIYRNKCNNHLILATLNNIENGVAPKTFVSENLNDLMDLYTNINIEHRHIVELFEHKDSEALFNFLLETHWSLRYTEYTPIPSVNTEKEKKEINVCR